MKYLCDKGADIDVKDDEGVRLYPFLIVAEQGEVYNIM